MAVLKKVDVSKEAGKSYKVNCERYNSVGEMVGLLKTRELINRNFDDFKTCYIDSNWTGVKTYDEALEFLDKGYQPVIEKLKERLKANIAGDGKRISFKNDVIGYAPIVPLAMQGVPQSMINHTMKPIKAKVIDLFYNISVVSSVTCQQIIDNGSKVLGAILELEQEGYKVNLYGLQDYSDERSSDILAVKIKDSRQPIDLKRMSFPLTHTAFFRVIGFDWYSKVPGGKYRSGYGHDMVRELGKEKATDVIRKCVGNDKAVVLYGREILNNGVEHIKEVIKNESGNKRSK